MRNHVQRFKQSCASTAAEANAVKFRHKLIFVAGVYLLWFVFGALLMAGASGMARDTGKLFDEQVRRDADAYEQLATEDPSRAAEYRREADIRRQLDGSFGALANEGADYIPRWWQGGLISGGVVAFLVLLGMLGVAFGDWILNRHQEDNPAPS